jgi:hypothetical protein
MIMDLTTECSSRDMIKELSVLTDSGYQGVVMICKQRLSLPATV